MWRFYVSMALLMTHGYILGYLQPPGLAIAPTCFAVGAINAFILKPVIKAYKSKT